ncbi:alpha/beta hydrolase [Corynebacterium breve]|uniref:prolyl aminopeptidase n=1 Tax=Corynebacterium breve TaxID=3049799 RepID=A0ABY8VIV8_9CORY|nr:alpha/beta hydrolase [Corynebacterium breve]WIM68695.1 alpha/beta hydrolase [Corynebacterium breve]
MTPQSKPLSPRRRLGAWKIIALIILFPVVVVVAFAGGKLAVINHSRNKVIQSHSISEIREYTLGGIPQKVMLDGADSSAPLVVYFHGGPGSPLPYNVGSRGMLPEVAEANILVTWDQYGSGVNDPGNLDDINLDTISQMAVDLIVELKKDFPENRLTVFGMSWGSVLAANVATEKPELIDEVVVYGQITHQLFINDETLRALDAAELSKKERMQLESVKAKETYTARDVEIISPMLMKRTEGFYAEGSRLTDFLDPILGSLISPDYSIGDFTALFKNSYTGKHEPLEELLRVDIRPQLKEVQVPYYIVQGDKDLVTSTAEVAKLIDDTSNSNLHFEIVDNSSHFPSPEATAYVLDFENFRAT